MMDNKQLDFMELAIKEELLDDKEMEIDEKKEAEYKANLEKEIETEPPVQEVKTTRRPYKIDTIDRAKDRQQEMAVFTGAKKLTEYILVITQKSPKKFRWSMVSKLQNSSIRIVELLYLANFDKDNRAKYLKECNVELSLLDFYAEASKRMQAINIKQMLNIGKQLLEVRKMLQGWIKSLNRKEVDKPNTK